MKYQTVLFIALTMSAASAVAQTAPIASTPVETVQAASVASGTNPASSSVPPNPHDPNAPTIAELLAPNDGELSRANGELLAKNAALETRVDELTTQLNVLVNERSGQLFLYGVITVLASLIIGFIIGFTMANRKRSNW